MNQEPIDVLLMVAHDLRSPLTTLRGHAELLLARLARQSEMDPAIPRQAQIIQREAIHLGQLLDRLTDVAWLQTGHFQLEKQPVELGELLQQLTEKMSLPSVLHTLTFTTSMITPCVVYGDPLRLEEIFRNLIDNAIKYSPQGGQIRLHLVQQSGEVRVTVADEGLGIPQEALPLLFAAWYRVEQGDHVSIRGLGLGLHIVWHLVRAHQGQITVTSTLGQGSTFEVVFPLSNPA